MSMQDLLKHMEELQKRTEDNMTKTMHSVVNQSKMEINENISTTISTLTKSVDGVKNDLSEIQAKYDRELGKLKEDFKGLNRMASDASGLASQVDKQTKTDSQRITSRCKSIEEDILGVKKSQIKELAGIRSSTSHELEQQRTLIGQQQQELEEFRNNMVREMDQLKVRSLSITNQVKQLSASLDAVDAKVRAANFTIAGLEEKEPVDTPLATLLELIRKVLPDFQERRIKSVFRLGQPKRNKKKPRLLMIICDNQDTKELILKNAGDIREKSTDNDLQINRDQSDGARRRHALVKACYKGLVAAGYTCSMKGAMIMFEKRQYGYDQLGFLPTAGRPEEVRNLGEILGDLVRAKFDQNVALKYKLVESRYATYHEMTKDKRWATGMQIPNNGQKLDPKQFSGKNKAGLMISKLRNEYRRELGLPTGPSTLPAETTTAATEGECIKVNGQSAPEEPLPPQ